MKSVNYLFWFMFAFKSLRAIRSCFSFVKWHTWNRKGDHIFLRKTRQSDLDRWDFDSWQVGYATCNNTVMQQWMLKWPCRVKLRAVMGVVPQTKIISKRISTKTKFQRLINLWSGNGGWAEDNKRSVAGRAKETKATQHNGSILSLFTESEAKKKQKRSNKRTIVYTGSGFQSLHACTGGTSAELIRSGFPKRIVSLKGYSTFFGNRLILQLPQS